ncbi:MAG: hypothetical protein U1E17_11260 [Geminicoccaceae bacterium]
MHLSVRPFLAVVAVLAGWLGGPAAQAQELGTTAPPPAPAPAAAAAVDPTLAPGPKAYLADRLGTLGTLDLGNGAVRVIGILRPSPRAARVVMTDIAFCPGGSLYGITFTTLYRINPATAQTTLIGGFGSRTLALNSLVCNATGQLLAYSNTSSRLFRVNRTSGLATLAGQGGSFRSAGDLAYHEGNLFLSSTNRQLVKLNKITGAPISSKLHNIANLFGLVSTGTNRLYGFADTQAYLLNEDTGGKTLLFQFAGRGLAQIYGAAFNGNFQS